MPREKFQVLSLSELIAPKGLFRSVITIDSEPYKIGEDVASFEEAKQKCQSHLQIMTLIQVYNDEGRALLKPTYTKLECQIRFTAPMEDICIFVKKIAKDTPPNTSLLVAVKSAVIDWKDVIPFIIPTTELAEGLDCIRGWITTLVPATPFLPNCFPTLVVYLINDDSEEPTEDEIYTHLITSVSVMMEAQNLK